MIDLDCEVQNVLKRIDEVDIYLREDKLDLSAELGKLQNLFGEFSVPFSCSDFVSSSAVQNPQCQGSLVVFQ